MMKSWVRIIILLFMFFAIGCSQEKRTDWRVSFDKNSKEPYGCYIAYHLLTNYFPHNEITSGRNIMTEINRSLDKKYAISSRKRISFMVCRSFEMDSLEMSKLDRYIKMGNTVCIFSENFSENIFSYFDLKYDRVSNSHSEHFTSYEDSIPNQHTTLFFNHKEYTFSFNGLSIQHGFTLDTTDQKQHFYLGYSTSKDTPNTVIRTVGEGNLIISRNPITMTNYFLLQNKNSEFASYFFSIFAEYPTSVTWYSKYVRSMNEDDEFNLFSLFKSPPLLYAFLSMLFLMLVYVLFEGKRRQREIPIVSGKTNTSLEFTETVGRLYFSKSDHKNLSDKMILHYLEQVRSKHGLKTTQLDEQFVYLLSQKLNRSEADTKSFVAYINYIRNSSDINEIDIKHLHQQLQNFI